MTNLEFIGKYVQAFAALGSLGRFNPLARKHLTPDFTNDKIQRKYGMTYEKYIHAAIDPDHDFALDKEYSEDKLQALVSALQTERVANAVLDKQLKIIETKQETRKVKKDMSTTATTEATEVLKEGEVKVQEKTVQAGLKFEVDIAGILSSAAKQYLDSDAAGILNHVDTRIKEEALKLRPTQVTIGERKPVEFKGKLHACFNVLVKTLQMERQAFLVGPAGTGKTTLASQAAKALDVAFGHISCTAGMSEAHLLGRMIADGSYIKSEFVELYENGGVFLFDEVDAADPNTLLIINSALANGYMSVPNRKDKPKALRHKDFFAVCAANTYGTGSNQYAGRSILDAAFLDRFCMGKIEVNYDKELERDILRDSPNLANKLWKIRQNIETNKLRRVLSTRAFVSSAINIANGTAEAHILDRFFTGWAREERAKATQGV